MTNRILIIICIIETIVIGCLSYQIYKKPKIIEVPIIEQIVKDSIIRDSIYIVNDIIKKEIKYVKKQYIEDSSFIMSSNDSVLFDSFSKYIEQYQNK